MLRNKSISTHQFEMVPSADVPRSTLPMPHSHKTTFDAGTLIPIYIQEVLPGDTFKVRMNAVARLATPLYPIMDNLHIETFFFYCPNRTLWTNWKKFWGEQDAPGDSNDYLVPVINNGATTRQPLSIYDYMGIPNLFQVPVNPVTHTALHFRAYNKIWNEWFRPEYIVDPVPQHVDDGPDPATDYVLLPRFKRPDYFTMGLPWTQRDGINVSVPLGVTAPVIPVPGAGPQLTRDGSVNYGLSSSAGTNPAFYTASVPTTGSMLWASATGLQTDLAAATAANINLLRQAFQIQRMLERDARGGVRYNERVWAHFKVRIPDHRVQRSEYLGGGHTMMNISPVAQTSGSPGAGAYTDTPLGNLAAIGTASVHHGFEQSFTEHGVIIGLVNVRGDITYQQGLHKMLFRRTEAEFYKPVFQALGEQSVLLKEIFCQGDNVTGDPGTNESAFAYMPRWDDYRHHPNKITGLFNSTNPTPIDGWHLAQHFATPPTLNRQFLEDPTKATLERALAVGPAAGGQQIIWDSVFQAHVTRLMPVYAPPGMIDHF